MTEILIYTPKDSYIVVVGIDGENKRTTGAPHFRLLIESEEDLLSLPQYLFDKIIRALVVGAIDIDEVTTPINSLIYAYGKGFPKQEPEYEVF